MMFTNHTLNEAIFWLLDLITNFKLAYRTVIKQSPVHHYTVTKCNTFQCKKRGKTALLLMHWWLETNLKLIFSTKQKPFSICYKRSTRNCIPYWQLSLFSNITQRWRSTVNCAALILFWPFRQKITLVHAQLQLFHELFWSCWVKIRSRDLCSNLSKD